MKVVFAGWLVKEPYTATLGAGSLSHLRIGVKHAINLLKLQPHYQNVIGLFAGSFPLIDCDFQNALLLVHR